MSILSIINYRILTITIFVIFCILVFLSITAFLPVKIIHSATLDNDEILEVRMYREFVGLSFQKKYYLYLKRNNGRAIRISGNTGNLPKSKRYYDMLVIQNFSDYEVKPGYGLFSVHYVNPKEVTLEEFNLICRLYRVKRDLWKELENTIDALVFGDMEMFHEIFTCNNGLFLYTDNSGGVIITDKPDYYALTLPAEKRNSNHIGFFDDNNVLKLRNGKIISGVIPDLFDRPSKKVIFSSDETAASDLSKQEIGFMNTLWADLLYSDKTFGINEELLLSSVNSEGKRLDEVFTYNE